MQIGYGVTELLAQSFPLLVSITPIQAEQPSARSSDICVLPAVDSVMVQVGGEMKGQKRVQRVKKRVGTEPGDMLE